ncbi:cinnamoyl-CoA reductase -like [Oryza sativa Japonica Group]|uniref:Cinnamoyl-CoA reductase-like n=1 Tax=Oryza sativa subsp. japonica TaxID=39947 RepID=Q5NA66_ORYSJ|nr:cinnamoyl-CoA reductase -like [Oryza sativa Japonica Group]BAD81639.1 cinnamoyl-CoA reductase -like [Oryza sativa Japonica Group]
MAFCSCSGGLIDWCACADDLCEGDAKNAHLMSLDVAVERLRLFKADLLDYGSVAAAIAGCDDVFHVHTLAAAVTGTTNVRKACSQARLGLGRVVVVSYVYAVMVNPNWPEGKAVDEDCNSCRSMRQRSRSLRRRRGRGRAALAASPSSPVMRTSAYPPRPMAGALRTSPHRRPSPSPRARRPARELDEG